VLESHDHLGQQGFAAAHDSTQGEGIIESGFLDQKLQEGGNAVKNGDPFFTDHLRYVTAITVTVSFRNYQTSSCYQGWENFTPSSIEGDRRL
jgi:hypothetical protein